MRPQLLDTPTPLHPAPRLAEALGLRPGDLWLKRDDLGGIGAGGNKLRKLEVAIAEARAVGADTLVTTGAAQSNHARLTAAVGARLGYDVVLVLGGAEPEHHRGNLLLDDLLGARLVWAGEDAGTDPAVLAAGTVAELEAEGRRVHLVPYGGTSPTTARGYATAADELREALPALAHVVVAVGSGGTMAGLVSVLGPERVLGVDTGAVDDARRTVADLLDAMGHPTRAEDLRIDTAQVGAGYGHLARSTRTAVELVARTEGVLLDATYVGRAAAGLVAATAAGTIGPGEPTVLLHTGGLPGLLGHPDLG
ncbi:MAG: pyridoxal-phosphate dependent enzyme [Nocardioides sp.]|nr:pyridoxal-phosphate dependent enzyme [Nocardioides sp.]